MRLDTVLQQYSTPFLSPRLPLPLPLPLLAVRELF